MARPMTFVNIVPFCGFYEIHELDTDRTLECGFLTLQGAVSFCNLQDWLIVEVEQEDY